MSNEKVKLSKINKSKMTKIKNQVRNVKGWVLIFTAITASSARYMVVTTFKYMLQSTSSI